jgi:hypothetical protein
MCLVLVLSPADIQLAHVLQHRDAPHTFTNRPLESNNTVTGTTPLFAHSAIGFTNRLGRTEYLPCCCDSTGYAENFGLNPELQEKRA